MAPEYTQSGPITERRTMTDFARLYMPTLDFVRALNARPAVAKLLFRLLVGRHAYREFLFMVKIIEQQGFGPFSEYGCEECEYHKDRQPWIWWRTEY